MSEVMYKARPAWPASPMIRMLALSLSLHLALIMLIQPAPGSSPQQTLVINARLAQADAPAVPETRPDAAPLAENLSVPAAVVPVVSERTPVSPATPAAPAPVAAPAATDPPPSAQPAPASSPANVPAAPAVADASAASRSAQGQSASLPQVPVLQDTRWYTAREVDVHPRALSQIQFEYPEAAREQGIQGTVRVMLKVDEFGRVRDLEVLESSPPGTFDASVREALLRAAFEAARRDGVPVRALMQIRVRFELE